MEREVDGEIEIKRNRDINRGKRTHVGAQFCSRGGLGEGQPANDKHAAPRA